MLVASWTGNGSDWITAKALSIQTKTVDIYEDSLIKMVDGIIKDTPVGLEGGQLKSNWQIKTKPNGNILKTKRGASSKSGFAEKRIRGKFAKAGKLKRIKNKVLYLFNNSAQVNVVEFGGYPDPVKLGTWNRKTKSYEIRSRGGYSKQAPKGMMRLNVFAYHRRIARRIKDI